MQVTTINIENGTKNIHATRDGGGVCVLLTDREAPGDFGAGCKEWRVVNEFDDAVLLCIATDFGVAPRHRHRIARALAPLFWLDK